MGQMAIFSQQLTIILICSFANKYNQQRKLSIVVAKQYIIKMYYGYMG
jgi:hypothetical protein